MNDAADDPTEPIDTTPGAEVVTYQPRAVALPTAKAAAEALDTYLEIQAVFDAKMPDAIMTIGNKKFRKKVYWRAIATAFHVECRLISEKRIEVDFDWGYIATYRAVAPDGRQVDGDGGCMASEKTVQRPVCPSCKSCLSSFTSRQAGAEDYYCWRKRGGCGHTWNTSPEMKMGDDDSQATIHNIRSHAHTRAKNRAIADLVGFGEVSADELPQGAADEPPAPSDDNEPPPPGDPDPTPRAKGAAKPKTAKAPRKKASSKKKDEDDVKMANEKQLRMLKAKSYGRAQELDIDINDEDIHEAAAAIRRVAMDELGFKEATDITAAGVNPMVKAIEKTVYDGGGTVVMPDGGVF